jgi:hypothetical protein
LMVGNPLTYMRYRNYGQYATFASHQLVPKPEFDAYLKAGCDLSDEADQHTCVQVSNRMDELTKDLVASTSTQPRTPEPADLILKPSSSGPRTQQKRRELMRHGASTQTPTLSCHKPAQNQRTLTHFV